ncbi:hypothetical protein [Pedobacter panaciterrae]
MFSVAVISFLIIKPALSYFKLSKNLSIEEAATLIGDHFFNVKDKLLNTLQLQALANQHPNNNQLILAGIDQKIMELRPVPFASAIKLKDNKKHIKYFLIPLSVILLIGIIAPAILREGTSSFVQYNKEILPKAPFDFVMLNKSLMVPQGDDFTLKLKTTGNELPQEVYVSDGANTYKLEKEGNNRFTYIFKNLQKNKNIQFSAGGFNSISHTIEVKPRPSVLNITAKLQYPAYLNKKEETIQNAGDLLIPEGTIVTWLLNTENSSALNFIIGGKQYALNSNSNSFSFTKKLQENTGYQITPKNSFINSKDSLSHQIAIIKDEFPNISIVETPDSVSSKALYFSGNISDDHGFSSLKFQYNIKENGILKSTVTKSISIKKNQQEDAFFYLWNLNETPLKPGQALEYYFEVADNDAVNGAKKTKSAIKIFEVPTQQQVAEKINQGNTELKQKMEKTIKLASEVEKDSKKLGETLLDKKQLSFDDKKQIEQLLDKQQQLEKAVEEIKSLNEKNTLQKEENNALKDELMEKQKKIDDLFNNVLNEKTKELLQKLQNLMDENNKDQTQTELSKMQMDNKSLKNELDRILELYKQLEFEQNLKNNTDRLNDLAKEQKELSQKSAEKDSGPNKLKEEQKKLSSEFDDIKKELEKLDEKNQQMERPNPLKILKKKHPKSNNNKRTARTN